MPNNISDTNPVSGFDRPVQSSEQNFVNCALRRERTLVSFMGDASWLPGFSGKKPFYHGLHPLPLPNHGKLLISWMVRLLVFQILGKLLLHRLDLMEFRVKPELEDQLAHLA